MDIREALVIDAEKIGKLVFSLSHFYLESTESELPTWFLSTLTINEFISRLTNSDYTNYVYEANGDIVGYISMKHDGHLYHLFVSEKHQGKGVARKLWNQMMKVVVLPKYTVRSSIYAIPIYKAFGFLESGAVGIKEGIQFQPMEYVVRS